MEYDAFREEKLKYEDIEIPDELLLMVRETIAADRRKKAVRQRARIIRMVGSVAAILFLCLTIGVNSSYAFAETVVKIPVVKSVAKAVIVRSYKADIIALDEQNSKPPERVPDSQQTPVETLPAVSGNDIVSENEESEQPVSQEPSEVPEGLDAWKSDMTLERFKEITELYAPEMEDRYAQEPEKLRTILLAEVAEKDISLYGYHVHTYMIVLKILHRFFNSSSHLIVVIMNQLREYRSKSLFLPGQAGRCLAGLVAHLLCCFYNSLSCFFIYIFFAVQSPAYRSN